MFPEKVPCGHGSGETGGHYKGPPLGDGARSPPSTGETMAQNEYFM